eukprot:scaffold26833_cov168-Amphora_coffeaeformis.AAC.3
MRNSTTSKQAKASLLEQKCTETMEYTTKLPWLQGPSNKCFSKDYYLLNVFASLNKKTCCGSRGGRNPRSKRCSQGKHVGKLLIHFSSQSKSPQTTHI